MQVQCSLLSEQRLYHEREVDKQVKAFVVKTIQFRNNFDTEGPLVPGLAPNEAVTRLGPSEAHCVFDADYSCVSLVPKQPVLPSEDSESYSNLIIPDNKLTVFDCTNMQSKTINLSY